jgi:hypothetical protein
MDGVITPACIRGTKPFPPWLSEFQMIKIGFTGHRLKRIESWGSGPVRRDEEKLFICADETYLLF